MQETHLKTLGLGPKFCLEPTLGDADILALARSVADRVPECERTRSVAEGAEVATTFKGKPGIKSKVNRLVDFMATSGIRPLISDKEGSFVVMQEGTFSEKGTPAVNKNLKRVKDKPADLGKGMLIYCARRS